MKRPPLPGRSFGIALIAGLALLAALSLLALVATSSMVLQHRMAGNLQEDQRAVQNASLGASWARAWLFSRAGDERQPDCESACILPAGIRNPGTLPAYPEQQNTAWWIANGIEAGKNPVTGATVSVVAGATETPRWIMEELHFAPEETGPDPDGNPVIMGIGYYRILGHGTGLRADSIAVTESIVARPWGGDLETDGFPPEPVRDGLCSLFGDPQKCGRLAWRQLR